jgi:UDP-2,3-diacylglucosamine pyrophosphatase LpxH
MRAHVTADLHANWTGDKIALPDVDCDVHIVVGDAADGLCNALRIVAEAFKDSTVPVAYVAGNHDYYISEREPNAFYQEQLERARILAPQMGVHLLHNDTLIVGSARVVGSTLWTDIRAGTDTMSRKMKMLLSQRGYLDERPGGVKDYHEDFRRIRFGGSGSKNRFTPSQMLALHDEAMTFLRDELAKDWDGETIVATHTSPSVQSLMAGSHMHDWLYSCTDCDDLFQHVDCWAHGHIHQSRDYEIDGCRVVANPRGYPTEPRRANAGTPAFENSAWDPGLVIDVERRYAPKIGGM